MDAHGSLQLQPPRFTIDLSLPPRERYRELASAYKERVQDLPLLFDEIVSDLRLPPRLSHTLSRLCLRRLHSHEETEELRGIAAVTGLSLWLLVAFNVLLDLFMGCTSGGVQTQGAGDEKARMLHFRTLDWGMDPLRRIIVTLDFVRRPHGPVLASSITYVGFVGVLTGVRHKLSMSLNFRPKHNSTNGFDDYRYYLNHLLILLGIRPSIASLLRQCLLPAPAPKASISSSMSLASILQWLPDSTTTAAYIIFCDGDRAVVLEKERATARLRQSDKFIVATNHDVDDEDKGTTAVANDAQDRSTLQVTGMETLVEESIHRKEHICKLCKKILRRSSRARSKTRRHDQDQVTVADVISWMKTYPIRNEETHFASVLDPEAGQILWSEYYIEPLESGEG